MFWNKKTVNCNECGCMVEERLAQRVLVRDVSPFMEVYGISDTFLYYCKSHKKNYDTVKKYYSTYSYYKTNQTVEVNEDGTPYKETKENAAADTVFSYTITDKPTKKRKLSH